MSLQLTIDIYIVLFYNITTRARKQYNILWNHFDVIFFLYEVLETMMKLLIEFDWKYYVLYKSQLVWFSLSCCVLCL